MHIEVIFCDSVNERTGEAVLNSWCVCLEPAGWTLVEGFARKKDADLAAKAFSAEGLIEVETYEEWDELIVSTWGLREERKKRAAQMLQW